MMRIKRQALPLLLIFGMTLSGCEAADMEAPETNTGEQAGTAEAPLPEPEVSEEDLQKIGAEHSKEARDAMRRGDYAVAYCIWLPMARAGNNDAQYALGWMYHHGYGLSIDDSRAIEWWEKAANNQHPEATMALALLYQYGGRGLKRDRVRAVGYFMRAVKDNDDDDAKLRLYSILSGRSGKARTAAMDEFKANPILLGDSLQIVAPKANLRAAPTTKAKRVAGLVQGDRVYEFTRQGKWVQIGIPGLSMVAWIHRDLVAPAPPPAPPSPPAVTTPEEEAGSALIEKVVSEEIISPAE